MKLFQTSIPFDRIFVISWKPDKRLLRKLTLDDGERFVGISFHPEGLKSNIHPNRHKMNVRIG